MFTGAGLSTANYDALLNGWNAQNLQDGVSFDGGNSTYCSGENARTNMINSDGWTITDTGRDCSSYDSIELAPGIRDQTTYQSSIFTGDASPSTSDPVLPDQCGINSNDKKGQATVWYKYYLANDDAISIDTIGSDYDTFIAIWEGSPGNLRFVACNDDTGGTKQSAVAIRVTGGKTYYIEIGQP